MVSFSFNFISLLNCSNYGPSEWLLFLNNSRKKKEKKMEIIKSQSVICSRENGFKMFTMTLGAVQFIQFRKLNLKLLYCNNLIINNRIKILINIAYYCIQLNHGFYLNSTLLYKYLQNFIV